MRTRKAVTRREVTIITEMWHKLHPADKERIVYPKRLGKSVWVVSRYRKTPAVSSLVLPVCGPVCLARTQGLEQVDWWEAMCMRLCRLHPSPKKSGNAGTPKWDLVAAEYANIRTLISDNHQLMRDTELQLYEVNRRTLQQWYNSAMKVKEKRILLQGQSINQYLFTTAYITSSHIRYKIDVGYSLGYATCQGCNPLEFNESNIYSLC